jgi:cytoskeletal protein CcmA (bactofilin family)
MFGNNSRDRDTRTSPSRTSQSQAMPGKRGIFSVIGPDVIITGNIVATADLHVDGRIEGDLNCGSLIQGAESQINGAVKAESARLAGSIDGSVSVRQLTIERAARITGDVEYETVSIENGASIDGRLKHIAADSGARNFEHAVALIAAPEERITLVSSNGEAA